MSYSIRACVCIGSRVETVDFSVIAHSRTTALDYALAFIEDAYGEDAVLLSLEATVE